MNRRKIRLLGLWAMGLAAMAGGFRLRAVSDVTRLDLVAAQKTRDHNLAEIQRLEKRDRVVAKYLAGLRAKPETQETPANRTAQELLARSMAKQEKYRALLDDPRMLQLTKARTGASIRIQYRELYRQLNLSPIQTAALEALLIEGRERREDVRIAAVSMKESLSNPDIRSLFDDEKRTLESQEQALLGPEAFRQLQTFEATAPGRALVEDVSVALTFSAAPLALDQKTKLLDLLKTYQANEPFDDTIAAPAFDWASLQAQARTFLTEPQMAELGSSIATAQYRRLQGDYGKMLMDWVHQNTPKDR